MMSSLPPPNTHASSRLLSLAFCAGAAATSWMSALASSQPAPVRQPKLRRRDACMTGLPLGMRTKYTANETYAETECSLCWRDATFPANNDKQPALFTA